ncbi:unnamed protein product [Rangifer tarandus platyrhynchus]|uniref:Uncharacterized protein n=2 Tax=Rangifer tarandus platyrhynchus TaxID=3082113 RepID=A0AC59Y525_RANTA|nr:unnamed protein product [Rangifer tarandus platyrhynchus]
MASGPLHKLFLLGAVFPSRRQKSLPLGSPPGFTVSEMRPSSVPRFLRMLVPEAPEVPGNSVWLLAQEQAPGRQWGRAARCQASIESCCRRPGACRLDAQGL